MIRIKYHTPGTAPATLLAKADPNAGPPTITLIQYYSESIFEGAFDTFEELMERYDPSKVNWINVDGLNDICLLQKFSERFHMHPS